MGQASIVVRATSCQGVSIGQSAAKPTEISQIGINLVAPDGTGDINNYTVIYVTNNQLLAEHLQVAGWPAVFDPHWPTNTRRARLRHPVSYTWRPLARVYRPIFYSELRTTRRPILNRSSWQIGGSRVMG